MYTHNKFINFEFIPRESNSYLIYNKFGLREKCIRRHKHPSFVHNKLHECEQCTENVPYTSTSVSNYF